ncbi:MAG: hypothetical protein M3Q06_11905, partial [Bacteroidota bacterium]|nr:hypothetical protein [Bacteroidota bacterium]
HMLEHPWINLTIVVKDTTLVMKLMNGKALAIKERGRPGIGIANVKQRLNLLYKDKHDLQITEDEEVFIVDLQVVLTRVAKEDRSSAPSPVLSEVVYG